MTAAPGPVVVGVSPTTGSPSALRWAADYATARGSRLVAVLAWHPTRAPAAPGGRPPGPLLTGGLPDPAGDAAQKVAAFVAAALGDTAGVECRAVRGTAVSSLLQCSADADLLVIGEPGPGRMASVKSGLVAPKLVLRAPCPVVVMPNRGV